MKLKTLLKRNELYVAIVILILGVVIHAISGQFFTVANIVDLIRSAMVTVLMALGMFFVIISGGLDIAFPAIASLATYIPMRYVIESDYSGSMLWPFLIAIFLGAIMGAFNGFLIGKWKLQSLIVTLGTASVYKGILMGAFNAQVYTRVPETVKVLSEKMLFEYYSESSEITSRLSSLVIISIIAILLTFFISRYTRLGRGIFAVGGDINSAQRAGYNVVGIQIFIYSYSGVMAALAGMLRTVLLTTVQPASFNTIDMVIISMVVIGGTSISGGYGTLTGTLLGVTLITIIRHSLVLIGIPSFWQSFFSGIMIIVGTGIVSYRALKLKNRPPMIVQEVKREPQNQ